MADLEHGWHRQVSCGFQALFIVVVWQSVLPWMYCRSAYAMLDRVQKQKIEQTNSSNLVNKKIKITSINCNSSAKMKLITMYIFIIIHA